MKKVISMAALAFLLFGDAECAVGGSLVLAGGGTGAQFGIVDRSPPVKYAAYIQGDGLPAAGPVSELLSSMRDRDSFELSDEAASSLGGSLRDGKIMHGVVVRGGGGDGRRVFECSFTDEPIQEGEIVFNAGEHRLRVAKGQLGELVASLKSGTGVVVSFPETVPDGAHERCVMTLSFAAATRVTDDGRRNVNLAAVLDTPEANAGGIPDIASDGLGNAKLTFTNGIAMNLFKETVARFALALT